MGNACSGSTPGVPDRLDRAAGRVIVSHVGSVNGVYDMSIKIGEGAFGSVSLGTHKATGVVRAIKTVSRRIAEQHFTMEISAMKAMDHPNIVKLFETFEDRRNIYFAMEFCRGGELFDRIVDCGKFSESHAALLVRQILSAVFYMHDSNLAHRDLKPENFLFSSRAPIESNVLKLIDFGLACPCKEGQILKSRTGTPYYMAPQVLRGRYDKQCDMWSVGVILYILLSGRPPIRGANDRETMKKVRLGQWSFAGQAWDHVSDDAKDLVSSLLHLSERDRLTAEQALNHDWVKHCAPRAKEAQLGGKLIERLRGFNVQNRLKQAALEIVANHLEEGRVKELREAFVSLDSNGDGKVSRDELAEGLERSGSDLSPADVEVILGHVDGDGSGSIDFSEFLAATLDMQRDLTEGVLWTVFNVFDKNGDGKITMQDFRSVLKNTRIPQDAATEAMRTVDVRSDEGVDFSAFKLLMRSSGPPAVGSMARKGAAGGA